MQAVCTLYALGHAKCALHIRAEEHCLCLLVGQVVPGAGDAQSTCAAWYTSVQIELLARMRRRAAQDGPGDFSAWQNAEVVAEAEKYYRTMVGGGPQSWNVRDTHMADTLDRLLRWYGPRARAVRPSRSARLMRSGASCRTLASNSIPRNPGWPTQAAARSTPSVDQPYPRTFQSRWRSCRSGRRTFYY